MKNRLKKILAVLLLGAMSFSFASCSEEADEPDTDKEDKPSSSGKSGGGNIGDVTLKEGDTYAVIKIKDYGEVTVKLFPDCAPIAVENFIDLAESGYYENKIIHRIIPDFMFQGGSPNGDGMSVPGEKTFDIEPTEKARHFYGALCMANAEGKNSQQFYIVNNKKSQELDSNYKMSVTDEVAEKYRQGGTAFLDGDYTVFGQTVAGFDVVDAVSAVKVDMSDKPLQDVVIESVTIHTYKEGDEINTDVQIKTENQAPPQSDSAATAGAGDSEPGDRGNIGEVALKSGDTYAVIKIKNYGEVTTKLFPECAPVAVQNFIDLAESGYYKNKLIHRIIPDFVFQGGSPNGDGRSNPGDDTFAVEPSNDARHFYGALCMANAGGRNSQQFYIVNNKKPQTPDSRYKMPVTDEVTEKYKNGGTAFLDGDYTVFGQTVDGFDVIDAVSAVRADGDDRPLEDVVIEDVTIHTFGE